MKPLAQGLHMIRTTDSAGRRFEKNTLHLREQEQCPLLPALLATYGRPGRVSSKRIQHMHFYLKCTNNNHSRILDVLQMEIRLPSLC